ncbi:MAG: helix-turn-helix domain-containing protein [Acidimicrobiia bacterium]|nr:helix-turn-helix domain-containing protein [Acidimicrobiia bacterium]
MDDDDRWAISVAEAGRRLDISRAHAYRLVASGELPSLRLGHRTVVPVWALRALLAEPAQKRLMSSAAGMREPVDTSGASASGRLVRFVGTDESGGGGRSC